MSYYFLETSYKPSNTNKLVKLHVVVLRKGDDKNVYMLVTNNKDLPSKKWVLEKHTKVFEFMRYDYEADECKLNNIPETHIAFDMINNLFAKKFVERNLDTCNYNQFVELTEVQTDACWFSQRMFRFTGKTSSRIMKSYYKENTTGGTSVEMKNVAEFLNYHIHRDPHMLLQHEIENATLTDLKEFCSQRKIKGYSSIKSTNIEKIDEMKIKLLEWRPLDHTDQMHQEMFDEWFRKGGAKTIAMDAGTYNESNIIKGVHALLETVTTTEIAYPKLKIQYLRNTGLLANKWYPFQAASPDGILIIKYKLNANDNEESIVPAVLEVKTRVGVETVHVMEELAGESKVSICDLRSCENLHDAGQLFATMIPDKTHREQILHQAASLGIQHSLYAEASTSGIRRVVLVIFSETIMCSYQKVLQNMAALLLPWVYNRNSSHGAMPNFSVYTLGRATDMYTLNQYLEIWDACVEWKQRNEKPLPPTIRIVPAQVSHWNGSKGAVDQRSRELRKLPYKNIPLEAALYDRNIMNVFLNAHHVWKSCVAYPKLDNYASLGGLLRANERLTVDSSLSYAMKFMRKIGNKACSKEAGYDAESDAGSDAVNNEDDSVTFMNMTRHKKEKFFTTNEGTTYRTKYYHSLIEAARNVDCVLCGKQYSMQRVFRKYLQISNCETPFSCFIPA